MLAARSSDAHGSAYRIAGFDELRGVAVLLVLFCHYAVACLPWGSGKPLVGVMASTEGVGKPKGADTILASIDGTAEGGYPTSLEIGGWAAVQGGEVTKVMLSADGAPFTSARLGVPRPDVAAAYPGAPVLSGWNWTWTWGADPLRAGEHTLRLKARTANGSSSVFQRRLFVREHGPWLSEVRWAPSIGQVGVDLFFVISGFLIGKILLQSRGAPGSISTFYARRFWRIIPLAVVVVAIYDLFHPEARSESWRCLFFCANSASASRQALGALGVFWTLSVEEQFYLVVPWLVALVPARFLGSVTGVFCLALIYPHLMIPFLEDGLVVISAATVVRCLPIALGVWLAMVHEQRVAKPALWLVAFILWAVVLLMRGGRLGLLDGVGLVLICSFVWLAATKRWALRIAPLRFLGVHCYGIYLLHAPFLNAFKQYFPTLGTASFLSLWLGTTLGLAALSYRFFEKPLMRLAPAQAKPLKPLASDGEDERRGSDLEEGRALVG